MIYFIKSLPNQADIWKMQIKRRKGIKIICRPNSDAVSVDILGIWLSKRFEAHMHLETDVIFGRSLS